MDYNDLLFANKANERVEDMLNYSRSAGGAVAMTRGLFILLKMFFCVLAPLAGSLFAS